MAMLGEFAITERSASTGAFANTVSSCSNHDSQHRHDRSDDRRFRYVDVDVDGWVEHDDDDGSEGSSRSVSMSVRRGAQAVAVVVSDRVDDGHRCASALSLCHYTSEDLHSYFSSSGPFCINHFD